MTPIEEIMRRAVERRTEWEREYPVVGYRNAWAPRKGTKAQTMWRVAIYRKANRKLLAQIAFVKGGKPARDAIYPRRAVLYG